VSWGACSFFWGRKQNQRFRESRLTKRGFPPHTFISIKATCDRRMSTSLYIDKGILHPMHGYMSLYVTANHFNDDMPPLLSIKKCDLPLVLLKILVVHVMNTKSNGVKADTVVVSICSVPPRVSIMIQLFLRRGSRYYI